MQKLKVAQETFTEMLSGLISSGVTFEAVDLENGWIIINFKGGH
tara:strand:+ start:3550 stop:3681 length:132 start_codon:yes stop_codon:yes gene_type:complete